MKEFEYEITKHSASDFNQLVYFCNAEGECSIDAVPVDETKVFMDMLNARGADGWELVQIFFGKDGLAVFWKRQI